MAYAVLRCAHAQAQDTQVTVFLNFFFFFVAKRAFLSSFLLVRQDQLPTTHTRERVGLLVLPPGRSPTREACTFPPVFTKCEEKGQPSCPC